MVGRSRRNQEQTKVVALNGSRSSDLRTWCWNNSVSMKEYYIVYTISMIFDSWLRLMPLLIRLCQLVKPLLAWGVTHGWILEREKDPNPKQLKAARRENSMNAKIWMRRHSKQSNGTLRLCRYRLGDLDAGALMGVVYRCEVLGSAWGLYAAAGGVARDGGCKRNLRNIKISKIYLCERLDLYYVSGLRSPSIGLALGLGL